MPCIAYRSGYKYQLVQDCLTPIEIKADPEIETEYISLDRNGVLRIKAGYAWDGPSGPAIDTLNFMRGSLVHDALYQLMREKRLNHDLYREAADRTLQRLCLEDGMSSLRAWWVYQGVRFGGGPAADPAHAKETIWAPHA